MSGNNKTLLLLVENRNGSEECVAVESAIKRNAIQENFDSNDLVVKNIFRSELSSAQHLDCEQFDTIVVIGATINFVNDFNQKLRAIKPNYKLIVGHVIQSYFYVFIDYGTNYGHISFKQYMESNGDHISTKFTDNHVYNTYFKLMASIMSAIIFCQLLDRSSANSRQLIDYSINSALISNPYSSVVPIFIVGCGKLGFQIVRNLIDMKMNHLVLIDNESVHKYNADKNYFSEEQLGSPKVEIVKRYACEHNSDAKIETFDYRIQEATTQFWEFAQKNNAMFVSAVDDVDTKRFINKMCLSYSLPFIDVGINSYSFHVQSIVPHNTESYYSVSDPPDIEYPLCVLNSFPQSIDQCAVWAKMKFDKWFNNTPKIASNWSECVKIARIQFEKCFNHKIRQLVFSLPVDHLNEDGTSFWFDKTFPHHLEFCFADDMHKNFILYFAHFLSKVHNIGVKMEETNSGFIDDVIKATAIPEFVLKRDKVISTDPNILATKYNSEQNNHSLNRQKYSKDDEIQLKFIHVTANLRATAYSIKNASLDQIRQLYYKNILCSNPTLITASALASIEVKKLLMLNGNYICNDNTFSNKNYFVNLSSFDLFIVSEPGKANVTQMSTNVEFTEWDSWLINESDGMSTLEDVLKHLKAVTGLNCSMMVMDDAKSIYLPDLFPNHHKRKKQLMREIITAYYKTIPNSVTLTVSYDNEHNDDISGPNVKFVFANS